jgi:ankyrin repeat protein
MRKWRRAFVVLVLLLIASWQINRRVLNPRNENGMTPLMVAADRGDAAEVQRLVARGGSVNAEVPSNDFAEFIAFLSWMQSTPHHDVGWTAVTYAARAGCLACLEALANAGADINHRGRGGETALSEAAGRNNMPAVEFLVGKGANAAQPVLLFLALGNGNHEMMRYVLERGAMPDNKVPGTTLYYSQATPLLAAVRRKDAEAVRLLLEYNANPEPREAKTGWSALRIAHREHLADIEELLRAAGATDDGEGAERLLAGIRAHDAATVRSALDAAGDPNATDDVGNPLVCIAAEHGDTESVAALLDHRANINALNGYKASPLYLAISFRHTDTAALLIDRGAEINPKQNSPLQIAVHTGDMDTVTLLLDKGADIHLGHDAALKTAAKSGNLEMLDLLLDRGADARATNDQNENALHVAAYNGSAEMLQRLIGKGVDVNAKQYIGQTALIIASALGRVDSVKLLLASGADPNIKDEDGKSALDHAARYPEIQAALRERGAR